MTSPTFGQLLATAAEELQQAQEALTTRTPRPAELVAAMIARNQVYAALGNVASLVYGRRCPPLANVRATNLQLREFVQDVLSGVDPAAHGRLLGIAMASAPIGSTPSVPPRPAGVHDSLVRAAQHIEAAHDLLSLHLDPQATIPFDERELTLLAPRRGDARRRNPSLRPRRARTPEGASIEVGPDGLRAAGAVALAAAQTVAVDDALLGHRGTPLETGMEQAVWEQLNIWATGELAHAVRGVANVAGGSFRRDGGLVASLATPAVLDRPGVARPVTSLADVAEVVRAVRLTIERDPAAATAATAAATVRLGHLLAAASAHAQGRVLDRVSAGRWVERESVWQHITDIRDLVPSPLIQEMTIAQRWLANTLRAAPAQVSAQPGLLNQVSTSVQDLITAMSGHLRAVAERRQLLPGRQQLLVRVVSGWHNNRQGIKVASTKWEWPSPGDEHLTKMLEVLTDKPLGRASGRAGRPPQKLAQLAFPSAADPVPDAAATPPAAAARAKNPGIGLSTTTWTGGLPRQARPR